MKLKCLVLFVFLCSFSSLASANIIVYPEETRSDRYWYGGTTFRAAWSKRSSQSFAVLTPIITPTVKRSAHNAGHRAVDNLIVVNRLATWWVKPAYGIGRIRITVPFPIYLASWDVKALERELERLGVKVKSKPVNKPVPKPGPVISG